MDCIIGMACKDFCIVAADANTIQSILVMKNDEDKLHKISDKMVLAVTGEAGDTNQFAEYIAKNIQLYKVRNGYDLTVKSAAHFTRHNLASSLRSQNRYNVNLILCGLDHQEGSEGKLFYIDYLGAMVEVPFAAHGYGGIIATSILDRYHNADLTVQQAYEVMGMCVKEIRKRLVINLPKFCVKVVDKNGIRPLEQIVA